MTIDQMWEELEKTSQPSGTMDRKVPTKARSSDAGIKTEGWVSSSQKIKFQALALDLSGKPQADAALDLLAGNRRGGKTWIAVACVIAAGIACGWLVGRVFGWATFRMPGDTLAKTGDGLDRKSVV